MKATDEKKPTPPFPQGEQEYPGSDETMHPQADHGERSYRGNNRLANKVAVVTGSDSGIGRAVALAFAREGADVVVSYLEEDEDAKETARLVQKAGRQVLVERGDLQHREKCQRVIERAVETFGRVDVLVNNAAYQMSIDSIHKITPEQLERTYRTNIFAMFYLCQAALPHMKAGSSIINTASIQAYEPSPTLLDYASTKAAIVNFTKGLAKQVIDKGIRVNAVAPGPVWTPLIPATMPKDTIQSFGESCEFNRPAQPVELAPLFVLLASDEASFVTGEVYGATGGKTPF